MKNEAVNPPQPYMKQRAQMLAEPRNLLHGTPAWDAARTARPAAMSESSDGFTRRICSGRLRSQGQKAAHQPKPRAATIAREPSQLLQRIRGTIKCGATAPPIRLDIQTMPCAVARSLSGIQSAIRREIAGKAPA
jgi:hypothetical protein